MSAEVLRPLSAPQVQQALWALGPDQEPQTLLARGMGRSYGDSALASRVLHTLSLDHLMSFDEATGVLQCEAGVSLGALLQVMIPRGWHLPVTPGTQWVTLGGAIASDVHGKNHHVAGCFSECVEAFDLMLANGDIVNCSRTKKINLFHATCGGMGLTGVILSVTLRLRPIETAFIQQTTYKAGHLEEVLELFELHQSATYSVAWIDCLARGQQLGRSLLMLGEHVTAEQAQGWSWMQKTRLGLKKGLLQTQAPSPRRVAFEMPDGLLNRHTIRAFNSLYYHRAWRTSSQQHLHANAYFYPLDQLQDWNHLYGSQGFVQYQFVLPKAAGWQGMRHILQRIALSTRGSFLAVLKAFGPHNDNWLSFPLEGYSLALDFKMEPGLLALLDELDAMVLDHGGRVYLAKDARMSRDTFRRSYPQWEAFQTLRERTGARGTFVSHQSKRLGLD